MHLHSLYCQRSSHTDISYPGPHEFLNTHLSISFCTACSYMSLPPALSFFSALQDFCCFFSFSTLLLITCVAHQGWLRDTAEGVPSYACVREALENQWGRSFGEPRWLMQDEKTLSLGWCCARTCGMAIVQHEWPEFTTLKRQP